LLFRTVDNVALTLDCKREDREQAPNATVVDSQSIEALVVRFQHLRPIAVGTDGKLLMVNLTIADISHGAGAQTIVPAVRKAWPWVKHLFANLACVRTRLMDAAAHCDFVLGDRPPSRQGARRQCFAYGGGWPSVPAAG
jgi:hypothetical protein